MCVTYFFLATQCERNIICKENRKQQNVKNHVTQGLHCSRSYEYWRGEFANLSDMCTLHVVSWLYGVLTCIVVIISYIILTLWKSKYEEHSFKISSLLHIFLPLNDRILEILSLSYLFKHWYFIRYDCSCFSSGLLPDGLACSVNCGKHDKRLIYKIFKTLFSIKCLQEVQSDFYLLWITDERTTLSLDNLYILLYHLFYHNIL